MRNVSKQFKKMLKDADRHLLYWADITLRDKTVLKIDDNILMQNDGFKIYDATSWPGSFDVGSVIINKLTLKLNNMEDEFSAYDFEGATVVAYTGMILSEGTTEKIRMGAYTVDESKAVGSMIVLDCLDNIRLLDRAYKRSTLQYPATLLQIIRDACECCGLSLNTENFENSDYLVKNRPDNEATTFREVMMWVAQIACKYVRCDSYGRLFLSWYDEPNYLEEYALADEMENKVHTDAGEDIIIFASPDIDPEKMDGGRFDKNMPYSTGDNMGGGLFNPWDDEISYDAGTFDAMKTYHHIWSLYSLCVSTDDIRITGVSVSLENELSEGTKYLFGETGYVLDIEKNGLIQDEAQAKNVAIMVGEKLVGMVFRTFDANHLSDPTLEAGDSAYVTDQKQNSYKTYITNTTFTSGGRQKSSCGAETPTRKQSERFTETTKAIVEAKKNTAKQIIRYDESVQMLTNLITQSFGVFKTAEHLEDGSTIYYMHNEPTLKESDTIWKMSADAFVVSTDGGKTWNAGIDSQGNAVVNVLSAIGISFDWAKGGTLTLGGENNMNGILQLLNAAGKVITTLDANGFSVDASDGKIVFTDYNGKKAGMIYTKNVVGTNGSVTYAPVLQAYGSKPASIVVDGERGVIELNGNTLEVGGGTTGKSGKAEFSDGSYLQFSKGVLTGGKTTSGTTF